MLNYPLMANQLTSSQIQEQQRMGYNRADVLADLNQRAYQNRLALGQQGMGLATGYNVPAAQESMRPTMGQVSTGYSWGWTGGMSSRTVKEILSTPDGAEILEKLASLPVAFWKYIAGEDREKHVGTFAEDFQEAFGLGNGATIDYRDMVGFLLVGLQALADKVEAMEA
jgi:hypothetical protein